MEDKFCGDRENSRVEEWHKSSKNGLIYSSVNDLESQDVAKIFDSWLNKICDLDPQEYKIDSMETLNPEIVMDLSLRIIVDVFGNTSDIQKIFNDFCKRVVNENIDSLLSGLHLTSCIDANDNTLSPQIFLPNVQYTSSVVSVVHQFAHYFCTKRNLEPTKKRYYMEIIPIYCEKYAIKYMTKFLNDPCFQKKLESTRVNSIIWHQRVNPNEIKTLLNGYANLNKPLYSFADMMVKAAFEIAFPWIETSDGIETMKEYRKYVADTYALGYLYGSALQRMNFIDERNVKDNIQLFFQGEKSLEELLKYYNITTENHSIYDDSYQELRMIIN